MNAVFKKISIALLSCILAVFAWFGLLQLANTASSARSYRASPAELRAAADAAVLPAAEPPFTGTDTYTEAEQTKAQADYYASIGGDPFDTEPLEPIIGKFVSSIPGSLPADTPDVFSASDENMETFIVNTSTNVFHLPGCYHIDQMSSENRSTFTGSRSEAAARYTPCKDCRP